MTAGNKRKSTVPVFLHRPGSQRLASGRIPSERAQPCLLASFNHREVLKHHLVSWFIPAPPKTRTPQAHKPPASTSPSARRLRQEPFDGALSVEISTCRVISALAAGPPHFLEVGEKCEKTVQTPHLQSQAMRLTRLRPVLGENREDLQENAENCLGLDNIQSILYPQATHHGRSDCRIHLAEDLASRKIVSQTSRTTRTRRRTNRQSSMVTHFRS